MSEFALIENGIVTKVIVATQNVINQNYSNNSEEWVRVSKVGKGFVKVNEIILPPKPYPEFILDIKNKKWIAPTNKPLDSQLYKWDPKISNWRVAENKKGGLNFK